MSNDTDNRNQGQAPPSSAFQDQNEQLYYQRIQQQQSMICQQQQQPFYMGRPVSSPPLPPNIVAMQPGAQHRPSFSSGKHFGSPTRAYRKESDPASKQQPHMRMATFTQAPFQSPPPQAFQSAPPQQFAYIPQPYHPQSPQSQALYQQQQRSPQQPPLQQAFYQQHQHYQMQQHPHQHFMQQGQHPSQNGKVAQQLHPQNPVYKRRPSSPTLQQQPHPGYTNNPSSPTQQQPKQSQRRPSEPLISHQRQQIRKTSAGVDPAVAGPIMNYPNGSNNWMQQQAQQLNSKQQKSSPSQQLKNHPVTSSPAKGARRASTSGPAELVVELEEDFGECVQDFLCMFDEKELEAEPFLKAYVETLLARWARRIIRRYNVPDSYAAAVVGAHRFVTHNNNQETENTKKIDLQLAHNLAVIQVQSQFQAWKNVNGGHGNVPGHSIAEVERSIATYKANYIRRAANWSPEAAAKAAAAGKKRFGQKRRSRFLSVLIENDVNNQSQQKQPSTARKNSSDILTVDNRPSPKPSKSPAKSPNFTRRQIKYYDPGQPDTVHSDLDKQQPRRRNMSSELLSPPVSPHLRADNSSRSGSIASLGGNGKERGRRGSAEALLQSVLDECESLIGVLNENEE